jgi:hypothetical protein
MMGTAPTGAALPQGAGNVIRDLTRPTQDVCFPEPQDQPARGLERAGLLTITLGVSPDLGDPVRSVVTSRELCQASFKIAPVPEVAVAEDHDAAFGEDDIGASGQAGMVEPVTQAPAPEHPAEYQLATRVRLCTGSARGR